MSNSMSATKGLFMRMDADDLQTQFDAYGRSDQFSREGVRQLFTHLDNMAENDDRNIELDVIALCCEYTESTTADVISDYLYATAAMEDKYEYLDGEMDEDGNYSSDAEQLWADYTEESVRQYLEENTMLISQHKDDNDNDVWLFRSF